MKTCLLLALVWLPLPISFALPTFPQEQSAVDPKTRQEIETVGIQFVEAYNKHDAAAVVALYTEGAVRVEDWTGGNLLVGRKAIETRFEKEFAASAPPLVRKPVQIYAFEDRVLTISEWSHGTDHGNTVKIYVRDPDPADLGTWKIRMEFITWAGMR